MVTLTILFFILLFLWSRHFHHVTDRTAWNALLVTDDVGESFNYRRDWICKFQFPIDLQKESSTITAIPVFDYIRRLRNETRGSVWLRTGQKPRQHTSSGGHSEASDAYDARVSIQDAVRGINRDQRRFELRGVNDA